MDSILQSQNYLNYNHQGAYLTQSPPQPDQDQFQQSLSKIYLKQITQELPKGCKNNHNTKRYQNRNNPPYTKRHQTLGQIETDSIDQRQKATINLEERRNDLAMKRVKRQIYLDQMRQINKNYSQFMRQFKKTKPLYEIKQEEFKLNENLQFEAKRQKTLNKLKQYYKPINIEDIKEHQRRYFQNKRKIQQRTPCNPQQLRATPNKKYFRGRSHDLMIKQLKQFKQKFKHKECESVAKMKEYCQKVLSKAKDKIITNQQKQRERSQTEPTEPLTPIQSQKPSTQQRRLSLYEQIKVNEPALSNLNISQFQCVSPSRPKFRKPLVVRDRYDVQKTIINQNSRRDKSIIQSQVSVRNSKQIQTNDTMKLEDDYVDSISHKIRVVSTKS